MVRRVNFIVIEVRDEYSLTEQIVKDLAKEISETYLFVGDSYAAYNDGFGHLVKVDDEPPEMPCNQD